MYFINPLSMTQQALTSMPGSGPFPTGPSFYGPMHQALTKAFGQSVMQQARAPQTISQMLLYPNFLPFENGGFNINKIIAPQPNNDWRIDWFAEDRAKAAAAAAAAAAAGAGGGGAIGGLLTRPGTFVGQNTIDFGSADGATGNDGGGVGGTGGVGGNAGAGTSDGPGGGGGG